VRLIVTPYIQDALVILGNLIYFLSILVQSDLVKDGATIYSESTFFYDSDDVYCVLGRIFSGFTGRLAISLDFTREWSLRFNGRRYFNDRNNDIQNPPPEKHHPFS